jgi:D-serine dehydratase
MIDGYYTVEDGELYALLALMAQTQDIRLEPSALAGAPGFARVTKEQQGYRTRMNLDDAAMRNATHIIWATGGGMVPQAEMNAYLEAGRQALAKA